MKDVTNAMYDHLTVRCPKLLPGGVRSCSSRLLAIIESTIGLRIEDDEKRIAILDDFDAIVGHMYSTGRKDEALAETRAANIPIQDIP